MNYAQQQSDPTKQIVGFVVVVIFHLVLIYALINGLGRAAIEVLKKPLETKIIEEVKKPDDAPPPPPPPAIAPPPPPYIPMPDFAVRTAPAANAITTTTVKPQAPPPPPAPVVQKAEPVKVPAVVDARSCRPPEYPSISRRLEETGTTVLSMLITTDGTVTQSKVAQSSGSARLDEAARQALSLCKFKPGSEDGKPVESWNQIKYTWRLE